MRQSMDSSQRVSRRSTGFDILQKAFENRIEVARRFPERRVPQPSQTMTVPFPQIAKGCGPDAYRKSAGR